MTTDPEVEQFVLIDNTVIDNLEHDLKTAIANESALMDSIIKLQGELDKTKRELNETKSLYDKAVVDLNHTEVQMMEYKMRHGQIIRDLQSKADETKQESARMIEELKQTIKELKDDLKACTSMINELSDVLD